MFAKEIYIRRRSALCGKMGSGLILIPGNMLTPNNYLNNAYYFRQDSSVPLLFRTQHPGTGRPDRCRLRRGCAVRRRLHGRRHHLDGAAAFAARTRGRSRRFEHLPLADLKTHLTKAIVQGRRIHYLPPYRAKPSCCSPTCWDSNRPHCTITSRSS